MNPQKMKTIINKEILGSEGLNAPKKAHLPVDISTQNSYSIANHKNNCSICQHPDTDQLHKHLLALNFKEILGKRSIVRGREVIISESTILDHLNKLKMYDDIGALHRSHQIKTLIKLDTDTEATPSHALAMNDQLAKQAGVYKANETPKSIQLFQQVNNILNQQAMNDNIAPTITGNDAPQSVIDQDYNNDGAKGESNQ